MWLTQLFTAPAFMWEKSFTVHANGLINYFADLK